MGRVNPPAENPIPAPKMQHFSHPHELELCNLTNHLSPTVCSACRIALASTDVTYTCRDCNFSLHLACAKLPQLITHPCHPTHSLTLVPTSSYPGGIFKCDACQHRGNGFSYHCIQCEYDIHVTCASKPLRINHQLHPCSLELNFESPYGAGKGFSCDICRKVSSKQWLYRCNACEFDAHLECVTATPGPVPVLQAARNHPVQLLQHRSFPGSVPQAQFQPHPSGASPFIQHSVSMGAVNPQTHFQAGCTGHAYGPVGPLGPAPIIHSASMGANRAVPQAQFQVPIMGGPANTSVMTNSRANNLMNTAIQGLVDGAAQQIGQTVMQSIIGGGGGGGAGGNIDIMGGIGDGSSIMGSIFGDSSSIDNAQTY